MFAFKCALATALVAALGFSQEVLTNEDILKLVKTGMGDDVILGAVSSKPGKFSVSTDDMIALKQAGVSDKIIAAMVARGVSPVPNATGITPTVVSSEPILLHDGTSVRLRLTRNLSSADAKTGDTGDFEVLEDVKANDIAEPRAQLHRGA